MECALLKQRQGTSLHMRTKRILAAALFAITWIASVTFGLRPPCSGHENTPGPAPATSPSLASFAHIHASRRTGRPTLMFAHPLPPH